MTEVITKAMVDKDLLQAQQAMLDFDPEVERHHPLLIVKAVNAGCALELQIEDAQTGRVRRLTSTEMREADAALFELAVLSAFRRAWKQIADRNDPPLVPPEGPRRWSGTVVFARPGAIATENHVVRASSEQEALDAVLALAAKSAHNDGAVQISAYVDAEEEAPAAMGPEGAPEWRGRVVFYREGQSFGPAFATEHHTVRAMTAVEAREALTRLGTASAHYAACQVCAAYLEADVGADVAGAG